jgi:hypothetical protein
MHCGAFYKLLSTTVASTPAERRVLYSRLAVRGAVAYVLTGGEAGGALPPLAGWRADEIAAAPAPTLVAGPAAAAVN